MCKNCKSATMTTNNKQDSCKCTCKGGCKCKCSEQESVQDTLLLDIKRDAEDEARGEVGLTLFAETCATEYSAKNADIRNTLSLMGYYKVFEKGCYPPTSRSAFINDALRAVDATKNMITVGSKMEGYSVEERQNFVLLASSILKLEHYHLERIGQAFQFFAETMFDVNRFMNEFDITLSGVCVCAPPIADLEHVRNDLEADGIAAPRHYDLAHTVYNRIAFDIAAITSLYERIKGVYPNDKTMNKVIEAPYLVVAPKSETAAPRDISHYEDSFDTVFLSFNELMAKAPFNNDGYKSGNVEVCSLCGGLYIINDLELQGLDYCAMCDHNNLAKCDECGAIFDSTSFGDTSAKIVRCSDTVCLCFDCQGDYYVCDCCHEYVPQDETLLDSDGAALCQDCYDQSYYTCCNCGLFVLSCNAHITDDSAYCERCYEESHESLDALIHPYGTTHAHKFIGNGAASHELYLGAELEIEFEDSASLYHFAQVVHDRYAAVVELKEDGSLGDYGVEAVFQPIAAIEFAAKNIIQEVAAIARRYGGESHYAGTCGYHIHISSEPLGDYGSMILHSLINRHKPFFVSFSRREDDYASYETISYDSDYLDHDEAMVSSLCLPSNRKQEYENKKSSYRSVAFNTHTWPTPTVEIRAYRGTLKESTLLATNQLTSGLALYARHVNNLLRDAVATNHKYDAKRILADHDRLSAKTMVRYVCNELDAHGIKYPELKEYLKERCNISLDD